jgi:hypothetical protein
MGVAQGSQSELGALLGEIGACRACRACAGEWPPAVLPMPHPSWRNTGWLKRNPWFEAEVVPYLRRRTTEILNRAASS